MKPYRTLFLKTLVLISALSSSLAFAGDAVSSTNSAAPTQAECHLTDPVEETNLMVTELLAVLKKDQKLVNADFSKVEDDIASILSPRIDIQKIAAFVTPRPLMASATGEQIDAYEKVLLKFFIDSYSSAFRHVPKGVRVIVNKLRPGMDKNDTVQINTTIYMDESGNPNSMIPVALIMTRDKKDCRWQYVDFVPDNISAVSNVQSQILSIDAKNLVELAALIKKHTDENDAISERK